VPRRFSRRGCEPHGDGGASEATRRETPSAERPTQHAHVSGQPAWLGERVRDDVDTAPLGSRTLALEAEGSMIERDVAELRARVAKLERKLALLEKHFGVSFADEAPGGVSADVLALVRKGDKLSAIRAHIAETGASLLDAKNLIDTLE
jgi:hypothetical protein